MASTREVFGAGGQVGIAVDVVVDVAATPLIIMFLPLQLMASLLLDLLRQQLQLFRLLPLLLFLFLFLLLQPQFFLALFFQQDLFQLALLFFKPKSSQLLFIQLLLLLSIGQQLLLSLTVFFDLGSGLWIPKQGELVKLMLVPIYKMVQYRNV